MSNIFLYNQDDELNAKLNIDELFEKKQQRDLNQLKVFNKLLNKVHIKIKEEANKNLQLCFFIVPEIILNAPKFDNASCIAYLIKQLQDNGLLVRYTHPNLLIISWGHCIPTYVRNEYKKKTGIVINQFGIVENHEKSANENEMDILSSINNNHITKQQDVNKDKKKEYTPINTYKPSGNLIYDDDILDSITTRLHK
jgi:hypothetical protein